jgi:hypothetical protein
MDSMAWLDGSLYPELDAPPSQLMTVAERADFIGRLCAAWDFGVYPYPETIAEIRQPFWREAVDRCQLLTSHTYHLLRRWHALPRLPYLGFTPAFVRDDPYLLAV